MKHPQNNIHLDYQITTKLYHLKVAALVDKHTPPGGTVLDIGCGAGNMLVDLVQRRPDLILDIADAHKSAAEITSQRVATRNSYIVSEKGFDIAPIKNHNYDTCVMSHVLEHITTPLTAIYAVLGLLKEKGKLILAVPNPVTPANFILAGLRRHQANPGHCFHWDQGHWRNFLENIAKLSVLEYDHDEAYIFKRTTPLASPLKQIEILVGNLFPGWSYSHLAVIIRQDE